MSMVGVDASMRNPINSTFDDFYYRTPTHLILNDDQLDLSVIKCIEKYKVKKVILFDSNRENLSDIYVKLDSINYIGIDERHFFSCEPNEKYRSDLVYNGDNNFYSESGKFFGCGNVNDPKYCGLLSDDSKRMVYASTDKIYVDDLKEYCIAKVCNTRVEPILSSKIPENYRCVTYVEMVGELCKKLV
jgi:hypothetical protein